MRTIIHEIDKRTRRISLVYRPKQNTLVKAQHHFTPTQKMVAKAKHEASFKNRKRNGYLKGRMELIEAIAGIKETPKMNLVVTVNTQI